MKKTNFHIVKRDAVPWHFSVLVRAAAIIASLLVSAVVITVLTKKNPIEIYTSMIKGAFGSELRIWSLVQNIAVLLCISLAVTPAFKMKFWNCGAEGQTLAGCMATAACMIYWGDVTPWVLIPVMLIVSILAGAIWGIIPAFFKAKYNTNETLFTLMMNYVAIQLTAFLEIVWENPKNSANVGVINLNTHGGWLPDLFGQKYLLNILVVVL